MKLGLVRHAQTTAVAGSCYGRSDVGVPAEHEDMLRLAASALDQAKKSGRNRCEIRLMQPSEEMVTVT